MAVIVAVAAVILVAVVLVALLLLVGGGDVGGGGGGSGGESKFLLSAARVRCHAPIVYLSHILFRLPGSELLFAAIELWNLSK